MGETTELNDLAAAKRRTSRALRRASPCNTAAARAGGFPPARAHFLFRERRCYNAYPGRPIRFRNSTLPRLFTAGQGLSRFELGRGSGLVSPSLAETRVSLVIAVFRHDGFSDMPRLVAGPGYAERRSGAGHAGAPAFLAILTWQCRPPFPRQTGQ
jgi:hypothetical protein